MKLHDLAPAPGSKKERTRVGRGLGSGLGKTAGKGHKGQNARAGGGVRPGFEGGQMPLIRRIPKRGFNNVRFGTQYAAVNLADLEQFAAGAKVDEAVMRQAGLANGKWDGIKVLGGGELTKKLTVTAHAFSASAKAKIEALGGVCEVVAAKVAATKQAAQA